MAGLKDLSDEQKTALSEFAKKNGRCWKNVLVWFWNSGEDSGALRQVRNVLGPSGVARLKTAEVLNFRSVSEVVPK